MTTPTTPTTPTPTTKPETLAAIHQVLAHLTEGQLAHTLAYLRRIDANWSAGPLPDNLMPYIENKSPDCIETPVYNAAAAGLLLREDHHCVYREYTHHGTLQIDGKPIPAEVERLQVWALDNRDGAIVLHQRLQVVDEFVGDAGDMLAQMADA